MNPDLNSPKEDRPKEKKPLSDSALYKMMEAEFRFASMQRSENEAKQVRRLKVAAIVILLILFFLGIWLGPKFWAAYQRLQKTQRLQQH